MELAMVQQAFSKGVFGQQGIDDRDVIAMISSNFGISAEQRIAIYRSAIISSLTRVLGELYPVLNQLLGDEFFEAMCRVYACQVPSTHPDLNGYGKEMAEFLKGFEPTSGMPYLPDVARLEWAWHEIFFEADDEPSDFSLLASLTEQEQGRVTFKLPSSVRLISSGFPVATIWEANQPGQTMTESIILDDGGQFLLVWRKGLNRCIERLTWDEWTILCAIQAGHCFLELIEDTSVSSDISALLPDMVKRGWLCGLTLNTERGDER